MDNDTIALKPDTDHAFDMAEPRRRNSRDTDADLARRYREGDRSAGDELLRRHDRDIRCAARKSLAHGLDFNDLLQEARIGFLRGALNFDETRGASLRTFAWRSSRSAARVFRRDHGTVVRVPAHAQGSRASDRQREWRRWLEMPPLGLDQPLDDVGVADKSDEWDVTLCDLIRSDKDVECEVVEVNLAALRSRVVAAALDDASVSDKDRVVAEDRVMSDDPAELRELGARLGVSHERIRQIEVGLIRRLRGAILRAARNCGVALADVL